MSHQTGRSYEFGPFRLDPVERVLLRDGKVVPLTAKVFDILVVLVENSGHLVEKNELMRAVWSDSFVEEGNLTRNISTLRKVLRERDGERQYIETVPKKGYRFVAEVKVSEGGSGWTLAHEQAKAPPDIQEPQARISDDEAIARNQVSPSIRKKSLIDRASSLKVVAICLALTALLIAAVHVSKLRRAESADGRASVKPVAVKSVAVLPFKPLGAGEDDQFLGLGMADVLITRLGSLNQISIRPMSAILRYLGQEQDPAAAGQDLKVDAVLEGSIHRISERMRVTARLVRVNDGSLIWADTFDGRAADVFAVEDAISQRVARALALDTTGEEKNLLAKHYTDNIEAYHAYTRGRYFWNKRTEEGIKKGIDYFKKAIEKDPHSGLADCYALLGCYGLVAPKEIFPRMKEAATKAVELDDQLAEAYTSLAYAKMLSDWDWAGAEQEFKRAIELNYNYGTAHHWYSEYLAAMGRFDEAPSEMRRSQELDPHSLIINANLGWILYLSHRYDEAMEEVNETLEMDPNFYLARAVKWQIYVARGMYDEASSTNESITGPVPEEKRRASVRLREAYLVSGWRGYLRTIVANTIEAAKQKDAPAYGLAQDYSLLGENDMALESLQRAYEQREPGMAVIKVDPLLDGLRADPRFTDLLRRMALEQ